MASWIHLPLSPCEEQELCWYLSPAPLQGGGCSQQVPAGSVGGRKREECLDPLPKIQAAAPPPSVALQPRLSHFCEHTAKNPSASPVSEHPRGRSCAPCALSPMETTASDRKAARISSGEGQVLLERGLGKRWDGSQPCWRRPR